MARPTSALIVDDEAHVRTFVRLLLRELGIETTWEAADGLTGLELVKKHRPGLVVLDVNLPAMNGLKVLEKISETHPELPVIILTSQSSLATVQEAVRLGAAGYVLKHSAKEKALEALQEVFASLENADDRAAP